MAVTSGNKFVNQLGSLTDPMFVEVVQRGKYTTTQGTVKPSLNVYNFRRKIVSGAFDADDVAATVQAAIQAAIVAAMNQRYTIDRWDCRALDDPSSAFGSSAAAINGEITTDSYAGDSAVYFLIRTGFRGRSFKGSKHYTPLNEEDTTNDELTGDGLTRWTAVRTALRALLSGIVDSAGNTWYPIVLSRELSNLEASPAVFTGADWNTVELNKTVGTMSRRKEPTVRA